MLYGHVFEEGGSYFFMTRLLTPYRDNDEEKFFSEKVVKTFMEETGSLDRLVQRTERWAEREGAEVQGLRELHGAKPCDTTARCLTALRQSVRVLAECLEHEEEELEKLKLENRLLKLIIARERESIFATARLLEEELGERQAVIDTARASGCDCVDEATSALAAKQHWH